MTIHVDGNWWQDLFDEMYLQTDARSVCNDALTRREVDFLESFLRPSKSAPILDLCGGQGRHALELGRRGYRNVTVLDYSRVLIELGRKIAARESLNTVFVQGDARQTGLPPDSVAFVIVMGSSFGYCLEHKENMRMLTEARRLLEPGGALLLDLPDRDYVLSHFRPFSRHAVNDDLEVQRTRELGEDIIFSREKVVSKRKGCLREQAYCTHLYSGQAITVMLTDAGFCEVVFQGDFMCREDEGDYGTMTHRMVVKAEKRVAEQGS